MKSFMTKGRILAVSGVASLVMVVAVWIGGADKWGMMVVGPETGGSSSLSSKLEEKLKEDPDEPSLKYNLAYYYYRQQLYEKAESLLLEVLDSAAADEKLILKASYNLGNIVFRQSEQETEAEKTLGLLKKSLSYYKTVIENEKSSGFYAGRTSEKDEDAAFNYGLVKQRIKILLDQIEKERKDQRRKKELFELLKALLKKEEQIKSQLSSIQSLEDVNKRNERRISLLKQQDENLELLSSVGEKIRDAIQTVGPQPSAAAPTI